MSARYDFLQQTLRATPKRWLVTGAAGFIGSHLVEKLLRLGQSVVGLDNLATGRLQNLEDVREALSAEEWARFRFLQGDVCHTEPCKTACEGVDYVLHQAALGSVPRSIAHPAASHQSNVDGFLNILLAARDARVKRFVYASSSSVYGDSANLPKVEHTIGKPLSPYAATKLINEIYGQTFQRCYDIRTIGLRYFNVFGPRQDPHGAYAAVIPRWFTAVLEGKEIELYGDGETTRDFCFIDNVVQANLLAAVVDVPEGIPAFNIAVGQRTSLNELASQICALLTAGRTGFSPKIVRGPQREGDVRHSLADISLARSQLGYEPSHKLQQGLAEVRDWYLRTSEATRCKDSSHAVHRR